MPKNQPIRQADSDRKKRLAKRLATYTAAATAAAATAVTDSDANAQIVYTDIVDTEIFEPSPGNGVIGGFDLDANGTIDVEFGMQHLYPGYGAALVKPGEGFTNPGPTHNRVAGSTIDGLFYAQNLAFDTLIDSTLPNLNAGGGTDKGYLAYGVASSCFYCELSATTTGFVGIYFDSDGEMKNGWVRLHVSDEGLNKVTVMDFAYNDSGGSIRAGQVPEPGSLGLLALGGAGLMSWRRRRNSQDSAAE